MVVVVGRWIVKSGWRADQRKVDCSDWVDNQVCWPTVQSTGQGEGFASRCSFGRTSWTIGNIYRRAEGREDLSCGVDEATKREPVEARTLSTH